MIKKIVNNVLTHYSEERRNEISEFLREQEIPEDEPNIISSCLFILSKLYQEVPNLKLIFDKNIKIEPIKLQIEFTREQIQSVIGIDVVQQIKDTGLINIIDKIKNEMINHENFLSTNNNFLSFSIIDNDTFSPKFCIFMNCKILPIKDVRKMKLNKIKSSKNYQLLP